MKIIQRNPQGTSQLFTSQNVPNHTIQQTNTIPRQKQLSNYLNSYFPEKNLISILSYEARWILPITSILSVAYYYSIYTIYHRAPDFYLLLSAFEGSFILRGLFGPALYIFHSLRDYKPIIRPLKGSDQLKPYAFPILIFITHLFSFGELFEIPQGKHAYFTPDIIRLNIFALGYFIGITDSLINFIHCFVLLLKRYYLYITQTS